MNWWMWPLAYFVIGLASTVPTVRWDRAAGHRRYNYRASTAPIFWLTILLWPLMLPFIGIACNYDRISLNSGVLGWIYTPKVIRKASK